MAIIAMRIPRLDRQLRSIIAVAQAPVKAFNKSVAEICGAVGKPLSAATRIHLATRNPPKDTQQ